MLVLGTDLMFLASGAPLRQRLTASKARFGAFFSGVEDKRTGIERASQRAPQDKFRRMNIYIRNMS